MPRSRKKKRSAGTGQISRWVKDFIQHGTIPDTSNKAAYDEYCWINLLAGCNVAGFPERKNSNWDGNRGYFHLTHPEVERDVLSQEELDAWDHSKDKKKYLNYFAD